MEKNCIFMHKSQKILINFLLIVFLFSVFYFLSTIKVQADDFGVACSQYQYPWCVKAAQSPAGFVGQFYKIALGLAGAAALGVMIYGAVLWTVSGAVSTKQDAKEWITGAVWGVVLLLSAYLILFTINPDLVNLTEPNITPLVLPAAAPLKPSAIPTICQGGMSQSEIEQKSLSDATFDVSQYFKDSNGKYCLPEQMRVPAGQTVVCQNGGFTPAEIDYMGPIQALNYIQDSKGNYCLPNQLQATTPIASSDAQLRQNLSDSTKGKITVNGPASQTSLSGLRPATLDGLLLLWTACNQLVKMATCSFVITGGTESGHNESGPYTHANGYKLDLRPNAELNDAIYNLFPQVNNQGPACLQNPLPINVSCYGIDGNTYRYEGDHLDICFQCGR